MIIPEHCTSGKHSDPLHVVGCSSEHTSSSSHPPLSTSHDGSQYTIPNVWFTIHCDPLAQVRFSQPVVNDSDIINM